MDGSVSLWDVTLILSGRANKVNGGLVQTKKFHSAPVNSIEFNQKPNIFASGSKDIVLVSIDPKALTMSVAFTCGTQDDNPITSMSWNDKVAHILAAATSSGVVYIWDMRKNTLYLTICDQSLVAEDEYKKDFINTKVCWCSDGVSLIIAYDHPEFNFLTQYDMRQPNAPSAEYHGGHAKPIYDIARNNVDTNFLISIARDYSVTCWSIRSAKALVHLNNIQASQIVWLTKVPDYFIAVGLDGSLNLHNVNFSNEIHNFTDNNEIPPKWLLKRSGVAFGFGGKFVTFSDKFNTNINVHALTGDVDLAEKMKNFIEKAEKPDITELLDEKIANSQDKNSALMWVALKFKYINNDNELANAMGFDKTKLQNEVYGYLGKKIQKDAKKTREVFNNNKNNLNLNKTDDAEDFWVKLSNTTDSKKDKVTTPKENVPQEKPQFVTEQVSKNINWNQGAEKLIKQSLLIGDLESAVDVALKSGRDAEALLIASARPELFHRTKQEFFKKNKDLFVKNIFSSIINNDFDALLEYNVLKDWKEYILYSKTYLSNEKFIQFANAIADKLAASNEVNTAIICYILSENYEKCIELIYKNYIKDTAKMSKKEKKNSTQNTFEIVISLKYVLQQNTQNEYFDNLVSEYCELLIDEGLLIQAYNYLIKIKNNSIRNLIMIDRLYNHCESKLGKQPKVQTPFTIIQVKPKVQKVVKTTQKVTTLHSNSNDLFGDISGSPFTKPIQANTTVRGLNRQGGNMPPKPNPIPTQVINPVPVQPVNPQPLVEPPKINKPTPMKPIVHPPKPLIKHTEPEVEQVVSKPNPMPVKPIVQPPKSNNILI